MREKGRERGRRRGRGRGRAVRRAGGGEEGVRERSGRLSFAAGRSGRSRKLLADRRRL